MKRCDGSVGAQAWRMQRHDGEHDAGGVTRVRLSRHLAVPPPLFCVILAPHAAAAAVVIIIVSKAQQRGARGGEKARAAADAVFVGQRDVQRNAGARNSGGGGVARRVRQWRQLSRSMRCILLVRGALVCDVHERQCDERRSCHAVRAAAAAAAQQRR